MKIINKTPHPIYILDENGAVMRMFPKSQGMIRVEEKVEIVGTLDGIPLTKTTYSNVMDLPAKVEGTYYIVSRMVKDAAGNRDDLVVPSQMVRNQDGLIMGCKALDL
jgi:hypothetical protein